MKSENNFSPAIHIALKDLINKKSKRDNIKFTSYQLASALAMPRSIITKLTHPDESKRISNPRIETLVKIVDFFRNDGFDITIEDLLGFKRSIDVQTQTIELVNETLSVSLYSLSNSKQKIGTFDLRLPNENKNIFALYAEKEIAPFFKAGSIFIIDIDAKPENDHLIAIKLDSSGIVQIKKYYKNKNKIILKSLNDDNEITLMPTQTCEILGVVIQVNAKT